MQVFIPDTNVFLRFLLKDVSEQFDIAKDLFNDAKQGKIKLKVPQIVIFEIAYALEKYYGFSKTEAIDKLKSLLSAKYFDIQDRLVLSKAVESYQKANLDISDCFLIEFAKISQAKIFTFDKNLKKLMSSPPHPIKDS